jgi:hypothetical protein
VLLSAAYLERSILLIVSREIVVYSSSVDDSLSELLLEPLSLWDPLLSLLVIWPLSWPLALVLYGL